MVNRTGRTAAVIFLLLFGILLSLISPVSADEVDNYPEGDAWLLLELKSWEGNQSDVWDQDDSAPDPQFRVCVDADGSNIDCFNSPTWNNNWTLGAVWNLTFDIPDDSSIINLTIECEDNDALNDDECDMNPIAGEWKLYFEFNWTTTTQADFSGDGRLDNDTSWREAASNWSISVTSLEEINALTPPIASVTAAEHHLYPNSLEDHGTKESGGSDWPVYLARMSAASGDVMVTFDACGSYDPNFPISGESGIAQYTWSVLSDYPSNQPTTDIKTYEWTMGCDWTYRFVNLTVDTSGIVTHVVTIKLEVVDYAGSVSEWVKIYVVVGPEDTDADGIADDVDACPNTDSGLSVDANGCASNQLDDDNDGVTNDGDQCPDTTMTVNREANSNGCSAEQIDSDSDGVMDAWDSCPQTPQGEVVDTSGQWMGCSSSQPDSDNAEPGPVEDDARSEISTEVVSPIATCLMPFCIALLLLGLIIYYMDGQDKKKKHKMKYQQPRATIPPSSPEFILLQQQRNQLQDVMTKHQQEKSTLHQQLQSQQGMTQSQLNEMQTKIEQLTEKLDSEAAEKARIESELKEEKGKSQTVVQNITYNIQDSAIAGDINANPKEKDD